jgi:maltose alpha-D-glucosyltransferase / alpha-amylase
MAKRPGSAGDRLWHEDAIIDESHVRAFKDSSGDGVGDFPGLIRKPDHLQDLGIIPRRLLSFFPSPAKDDGDDISDYLNVRAMYGTMDDSRFVLAAAHACTLQFPLARSSKEGDACGR